MIDFPNAPTIGQSFTSGNQTWVWDGVAWAVTDSPVPNAADYVLRSGDVMTGQLQVPSLLVNVDASVAGKLILAGDPVQPLQAATKAYVDTLRADADGRYLKLTGGTLTGNLIIAPVNAGINNSLALKRFDGTNAGVLYREYQNDHILLLRYDTNGTTIQTSLRLLPTDITAVGMAAAPPAADSLMTLGRSDARFARYRDDWVTGSYPAWSIVNHHGGTWIATTTTSQEPGPAATQWDALGGASGAYVGATPPTNPVAGQLWYCTVAPVGLFVWFVDVDSGQWVSTDGSGGISQESADGRYLALTGGTLTGALTLPLAAPTAAAQAANKAYVDAKAGAYLPLAGGTLTGMVTVAPPDGNNAMLLFMRPTTGYASLIQFKDAPGPPRWEIVHGPGVDAPLTIARRSAGGSYQNTPLTLKADGVIIATGVFKLYGAGAADTGAPSPTSLEHAILTLNKAVGLRTNAINTFMNGVQRWQMNIGDGTAEGGANTGSDFSLVSFADAGASSQLALALHIERASGWVTFNGNGATLPPPSGGPFGNASLRLNKGGAGPGYYVNILGMMNGLTRWNITLGTSASETGSNVGSDFTITRSNDAGAGIDTPLTILRSSGKVLLGAVNGGVDVKSYMSLSGAVGTDHSIYGVAGAANRWAVNLGTATPETGSNAGSDFVIASFVDGGAYLASPLYIKRSTGVTTFSAAIVNGPSDATLKANIAPITAALDKVLALQGRSFNMLSTPDRTEIGLIAQEVEPIVPELIQHFDYRLSEHETVPKLAVDYSRLTALLVEAVKELAAQVAELRGQAS